MGSTVGGREERHQVRRMHGVKRRLRTAWCEIAGGGLFGEKHVRVRACKKLFQGCVHGGSQEPTYGYAVVGKKGPKMEPCISHS